MDRIIKKDHTGPKPLNVIYQKIFQKKMDSGMNGLIEIGAKGHFPLFLPQWIYSVFTNTSETQIKKSKSPTSKELLNFEKILTCLSSYPSLEKKKILLFTLNNKDRDQFINVFLNMVESKILDQNNIIQ